MSNNTIVLIPAKEFTTSTLCMCIKESGMLMHALTLGALSRAPTQEEIDTVGKGLGIDTYFAPYNLYELSEWGEALQIGDWFFNMSLRQFSNKDLFTPCKINKQVEADQANTNRAVWQKVIRTTDQSLSADIRGFTDESINTFIHEYNERQEREKDMPKPLENINWSGVIKSCEAIVKQVIDGTYYAEDNDEAQYMFEEVLETVYGKDFFKWFNLNT